MKKVKKKTKPKHGGKREGSGGKLKYGEPTVVLTFRVPVSQEDTIRSLVITKLKESLI